MSPAPRADQLAFWRSRPRATRLLEHMLGCPATELAPMGATHSLQRAAELGLAPALRALLAAHDSLPAEIEAQLLPNLRTLRLQFLAQRHETDALFEIARREGLPLLLLKGQALDQMLFDGAGLRSSRDIDLLCKPQHLERLGQLLQARGYDLVESIDRVHDREAVFRHETLGHIVELHWSLSYPGLPQQPVQEVFKNAQELGMWQVMDRADTLLHLASHFFDHAGYLKVLFDVAAFLDRFDEPILRAQTQQRAQELGMSGILAWPQVSLRALGAPIEPAPHDWLVEMMGLIVARNAHGVLASPEPLPVWSLAGAKSSRLFKGHQMLYSITKMAALDGPRAKLAGMLRPLFLDPQTIAAGHGRDQILARDHAERALRPMILLAKQLRELWHYLRSGEFGG